MKRIVIFFFLFTLGCSISSWAQKEHKPFSVDSLFMQDLKVHFQSVSEHDEKIARQILSDFNYQWTSGLLLPDQREQARNVCLQLLEQKLSVSPFYSNYLNTVNLLVKKSSLPEAFNEFDKSILFCLNGKNAARNFLAYLEKVVLMLDNLALEKTNTEAWMCRSAPFRFAFDSMPCFELNNVTLACLMRDDSACIYETRGRYYPLLQKWYGTGGKVYWDRVGLSREEVFATLADYVINTRLTYYSADSVIMYHGGFIKKPLKGRLEEKVMADITAEKAHYPKFSMYSGDNVIINLFKNIEYEGGFSVEGSKVVGFPANRNLPQITISRNGEPFIELRSKEFIIRPDRFVSARSIAVIHLQNDSIFHPCVQVRYNLENNELALTRADEGLSQSPFFNSYHRLDMLPEAMYWKLDDARISFEAIRGIRSRGEALFESSDYFSAYRFDKLQGIDDVNPANQVSAYARRNSTDRFFAEDYASHIKMPLEQVRAQLIKLANAGFLIYDLDNDFVKLKPRLNEFLASHNGVKDYDIIQFNSMVEKGSNADLNLETLNLTIYGVKHVMLSDSQYVYIVPKDGKILMHQNRDFTFVGRVHAGLIDFYAHECSFDYEKFLINLPHIDSLALSVPSWEVDAAGYHHLVRVKNVLSDMSGILEIDALNSKSGRKSFANFPRFTSRDISYVYFDKKSIVKGVYKRENFYYNVDPFIMDSLNRLPVENIQFSGRLYSGNIMPDIVEPLRVQRDYSLGFQKVIVSPGISLYGGKGTFSDTLRLSNQGLRGAGSLNYLSSITRSSDFLFCPDSTSGMVQDYNLSRRFGQAENPDAKVNEAKITWMPNKDVMYVSNTSKEKFRMFDNKATLDGDLALTPSGLSGRGVLAFEEAEVRSNTYRFKTTAFTSDTADFTLFTPDHKEEALKVHVFRTEIDFTRREGHFTASGKGALMEFPVNKINCVVDEFDWLMDRQQLQLVNQTAFSMEKYQRMTPEELIKLDPKAERYVSTDPKQDSLRFFAMTALYDLSTNILKVESARILRIADAAIFPKDGKLTIARDGVIQELKNASIVANATNQFHTIYDATVNVESRKKYKATGLYDYKPMDGEVQTLKMRHVSADKDGTSYALASIPDSLNFTLSRYFGFKGNMEIHADKKPLYFEGGYLLNHECYKIPKEWVKLNAYIDPMKVQIPVEGDIENLGNGKLRVSVFYSMTDNTYKPGFFVKPANITDQDLIAANGILVYDTKKGEYRVTSAEKQKEATKAGNVVALNTSRCVMQGEGMVNLTGDLGRLSMRAAGQVFHSTISDSTAVNIMMVLDYFFSDEALKVMADDFNASDLKGIDIGNINYTRPLREFIGEVEADKLLTELSLYGQYRKFPEILNHTMVFSDVTLIWDPEMRSFISNGSIGISNLGKYAVNKYLKAYIEIIKRRTGDMFNIYLEPTPGAWYFFSYSGNTLQALSSNKEFNEKLTGLKEDQRVIKSGNGEPSYQFLISTSDKKTTFLRKMKQLKGE